MEEGFRVGNWEARHTYGESTDRELTGNNPENMKGQRWVVLRANWNREARAGRQNTRERAGFQKNTQGGQGLKGSDAVRAIRIASLNFHSGRAGGLEVALWALRQGNAGVVIFQDIKLTNGIHTRYCESY